MKKINKLIFINDIGTLIQGLYGADYLTHKYEKYGMKSLLVLESVFRPDKSYLGEHVVKVLNINKDIYENKWENNVMLDFFRTHHYHLNEYRQVLIPGSTRFKENNSPEDLIEVFQLKSKILASKKDGEYVKYVICVNGR